ncbi:MAG: group II intron reverse transcriptase/maturase [Deltaproteobacteria bacterium]
MSLKTPESVRQLQRKLYVAAKQQPERRFHQLYDKIYRADILEYAYALAQSNAGAPGVDGVRFEDIESGGLEEWLSGLRKELHEKTYKPSPVRRVMIEKPGGGDRPLGIPTIRDRVAQTAAKLVVEPIFEADFEPSAYGYRPGRGAKDAVREVHRGLCEGYTEVVDADLTKYFDTIPHHELMRSVARRIVDRQMLKLIKAWLKVAVEERDERGNRRMTGGKGSKMGTPQGGVISPLLANIYMHRFLRAWRERGKGKQYQARIVNYADDFVILSRSQAAQALQWTRWAMQAIKLTLNESKTSIRNARQERFQFLGYSFGPERYRKDGHWYLAAQPCDRAIQRVKERVEALLQPGNQDPWNNVVRQLNRILRGWANYFRYGTRFKAYRAIDNYVYHRAANFLRRRHKVRQRNIRQYSAEAIFGKYGVQRLRALHVGTTVCATT